MKYLKSIVAVLALVGCVDGGGEGQTDSGGGTAQAGSGAAGMGAAGMGGGASGEVDQYYCVCDLNGTTLDKESWDAIGIGSMPVAGVMSGKIAATTPEAAAEGAETAICEAQVGVCNVECGQCVTCDFDQFGVGECG